MRTRKAILKRFKFTRTGKILRRQTGQNHFRAKKTGNQIRKLRKWVRLSKPEERVIRRLMSR